MPKFTNPPLARHEALAPLSRDHYAGLVEAQHLIKAAASDDITRRKATAAFVDSWDSTIHPHFKEEEHCLAPLASDAQRERLFAEHQELADLAQQMRHERRQVAPDAAVLHAMGTKLNAHIRWEERELFEQLQATLSDEVLTQLEDHTRRIEADRQRNVCRTGAGKGAA